MKKRVTIVGVIVLSTVLNIISGKEVRADLIENTNNMYRLYNPNNGEHFYTSSDLERDNLRKYGWKFEGAGWMAPVSGDKVYRLYNGNVGEHHYTLSIDERNGLINAGWSYEGISWYSDVNETVPIYRAYNPNAITGTHNYTKNQSEQKNLINVGWKNEGISWYGITREFDSSLVNEATGTEIMSEWQLGSSVGQSIFKLTISLYNNSSERIVVNTKNLKFIYANKSYGPDTINSSHEEIQIIEPYEVITFQNLFPDFSGQRAYGGFTIYYKNEPIQTQLSIY